MLSVASIHDSFMLKDIERVGSALEGLLECLEWMILCDGIDANALQCVPLINGVF